MIPSALASVADTNIDRPVHLVYVWLVAAAGALGGLLFGYDWVVIGGAKPFYEQYFKLQSTSLEGWAMSCALIGSLIGAVTSGGLSNRFGRKRLLTLAALSFAISSVGTGLAEHFSAFVMWRIVGGYAIGLASGISPMYIAEISPAHLRGRMVSLNQLAIVFGILLAQVVNWFIAQPVPHGATAHEILLSWNGQWGWRWMLAVAAVPAVLFLIATFLVPEGPRWLASKGRNGRALRVFARLGGMEYATQVMIDFTSANEAEPKGSLLHDLSAPCMARALLLGVVLAVLQQWCGINVIFNYAQAIFAAAGYQVSDIIFNIVITGAVNVIFTLFALAATDRFGRRFLLLIGVSGLVVIYTLLGLLYHLHLQGRHHVGARSRGHCMLCHVIGTCSLGSDCGDLPKPNSEQRRFNHCYCSVDRLLPPYIHVSDLERSAWGCGHVLDLRDRRFAWPAVSL